MQHSKRIVAGWIMAIRAAGTSEPRLEFQLCSSPIAIANAVWCSAPTVWPNGAPLELKPGHLAAARKYFVGRWAEFEIDEEGAITRQLVWEYSNHAAPPAPLGFASDFLGDYVP